MSKKSVFFIACLLGIILFSVWFFGLPAFPQGPKEPADIGWRTIEKTTNGWERGAFSESETGWKSFQQDTLLIYGKGPTPQIDLDAKLVDVSGGGQWFIRLINASEKLTLKSTFVTGELQNGGLFVDNEKKTLMNFDTEFTTASKELIGPSFMLQDGKQAFFDIGEQTDLIDPEMWGVYTVFVPRDEQYVLGTADKSDIDNYIKNALEREPESGEEGFFTRDISARNTLEEVKNLVGKIELDQPCGTQADACFALLNETITSGIAEFPDVFESLNRMVQSWVKSKKAEQQIAVSWQDIFAIYHDDIITDNPRAKVKRDNAILQMIRTGQAEATYDVWKYLTNMLAKQKIGSAYSIQIMREMIRIGDTLSSDPTITPDERTILKKTALDSLANLKGILENTYFTKRDYLYILRSDLVDSEGKSIQTDVFVEDLQSLVRQVDSSSLFETSNSGSMELQTIRGQLAWFTCILGKNAAYVKNPRVCRTTTG